MKFEIENKLPVWSESGCHQLLRLFPCAGIAVQHPAARDTVDVAEAILQHLQQ